MTAQEDGTPVVVRRLRAFGSPWHLALRFFGSLSPAGPRPTEEDWALEQLSENERALFSRMSAADRRHAVGVARTAVAFAERDGTTLSSLPDGFVGAALLHDVGKIETRLGTFGRVWCTLAALVLGRRRVVAWGDGRAGWRREMARYLSHDEIGAGLLAAAGSGELVVSWARDHHLPPERWGAGPVIGRYLKEADGD